jgi:hypothetical protein
MAGSGQVSHDNNNLSDVFVRDDLGVFFADNDSDGFAGFTSRVHAATAPAGYLDDYSDCNDADAGVHPGAMEVCNGIDDDCDGIAEPAPVAAYCTPSTTTNACVPTFDGLGAPSASSTSGFTLSVVAVEPQRSGMLMYGQGAAAVPWAVGSTSFLCVTVPRQRTGVQGSGGSVGTLCSGTLTLDWLAYMAANPAALGNPLSGGQTFYAQGWFRDPGAPRNSNLSNGLRFTLCP